MIVTKQRHLPLRAAMRYFDVRYDIPVPKTTIHRWCRRGIQTKFGRVYLNHKRIGGKLYTTRTWIEEFMRDLARADAAQDSATPPPTREELLAQRQQEIAKAEAEADRRL